MLSQGPIRRSAIRSMLGACTVALTLATPALADVVELHDRGNTLRLEGADAASLANLCISLLVNATSTSGVATAALVRDMRANEVAIEVHFEPPREVKLLIGKEPHQRVEHVLIAVTGYGGVDGNLADILVGRTAPPDERGDHMFGVEHLNPPDENGVQYSLIYVAPGGLVPLREALAQRGIDAPVSTPRSTPDRAKLLTPLQVPTPEL